MKKQRPWQCTITRAVNGYVLSYYEDLLSNGDEDVITKKLIAVEDHENGDEAVTMQSLLYEITEYFGVYNGLRVELLDAEGNVIDPAPQNKPYKKKKVKLINHE